MPLKPLTKFQKSLVLCFLDERFPKRVRTLKGVAEETRALPELVKTELDQLSHIFAAGEGDLEGKYMLSTTHLVQYYLPLNPELFGQTKPETEAQMIGPWQTLDNVPANTGETILCWHQNNFPFLARAIMLSKNGADCLRFEREVGSGHHHYPSAEVTHWMKVDRPIVPEKVQPEIPEISTTLEPEAVEVIP
jgi:hypothetical protein